MIITLLVCLLIPFVIYYYRDYTYAKIKLDYILLAYCIGILLKLATFDFFSREVIQGMIYLSIPLAMPLLIFKADFVQWLKQAPLTVKSFCIACFCICLVGYIVGKYLIYDEIEKKIVAMLVGVFIGGTPNLNAIGLSLKVPFEVIAIANTVDLMASSLFILFMLFIQPLLQKILPYPFIRFQSSISAPYHKRETLFQKLLPLLLTIFVTLFSVGTSFIFFGDLKIPFFMLMITILGIVGSTQPYIRNLSQNENYANFLITVFCFSTGLILEITQIFQHLDMLFVASFLIVFLSFGLQVLLSRIFRINPEVMMICAVACVMSPAFIPMFVKHFKNDDLLLPGITAGLAGFAISNILGLGIYSLL